MNEEEYLNEAARAITNNFRPDATGSMSAARAGFLVRSATGMQPKRAGFTQFSQVLYELERRGLLRVGDNPRGLLAIKLGAQGTQEQREAAPQRAEADYIQFRRLKSYVWLAFVANFPEGRRFMNKQTGRVLKAREIAPEPMEEWIEIPDSERKSNREDAIAFLRDENLPEEERLKKALNSETWFRDFPSELLRINPGLERKWKRRRANRVITLVEQWTKHHEIPDEMVYDSARSQAADPAQIALAPPNTLLARDAVMSALAKMPTEELLDLRLPARFVIAAIRPELLNG